MVRSYPEVVLLELTTSWVFLPFSSERNFVPLVGNNRYIITLTSSRNFYVLSVQLQHFLLLGSGCGGDLLLWTTLNGISQKKKKLTFRVLFPADVTAKTVFETIHYPVINENFIIKRLTLFPQEDV